MSKNSLEMKILKTVRASQPTKPVEIVQQVTKDRKQAKMAREVIRSLVDKGELLVTLDWKVRASGR